VLRGSARLASLRCCALRHDVVQAIPSVRGHWPTASTRSNLRHRSRLLASVTSSAWALVSTSRTQTTSHMTASVPLARRPSTSCPSSRPSRQCGSSGMSTSRTTSRRTAALASRRSGWRWACPPTSRRTPPRARSGTRQDIPTPRWRRAAQEAHLP